MKILRTINNSEIYSTDVIFNVDVPNYYKREELSITDLKTITSIGKEAWEVNRKNKSNTATPSYFALGSAVHCLILEPEKFKDSFYIVEGATPGSPNMSAFVEDMITAREEWLRTKNELTLDDYKVQSYKKRYSTKSLKPDEIVDKALDLYKTLENYINQQIACKGTDIIPITKKDYEQAVDMAESFKRSDIGKQLQNTEGLIFIESELFWEPTMSANFSPLQMKSKIDLIWIPKYKGKYIHPIIIDLKTTEKIGLKDMDRLIDDYGYGIQATAYKVAWNQNVNYLKYMSIEGTPIFTEEEQEAFKPDPYTYLICISKLEPYEVLPHQLILGEEDTDEIDTLLSWYTITYGIQHINTDRPTKTIPLQAIAQTAYGSGDFDENYEDDRPFSY